MREGRLLPYKLKLMWHEYVCWGAIGPTPISSVL